MLLFKQCLAFIGILGATILIALNVPGIDDFDIQVNGWGWAWYLGGMIAYFIVHDLVFGRIDKALGVTESTRSNLQVFGYEATKWYAFPVGATLGSLALPAAFTFVNPLAGVALVAIMGVGFGLEKVAQRWIRASHNAKLARQAEEKSKGEDKGDGK